MQPAGADPLWTGFLAVTQSSDSCVDLPAQKIGKIISVMLRTSYSVPDRSPAWAPKVNSDN